MMKAYKLLAGGFLAVVLSGSAHATAVLTPNGDPFPTGSIVNLDGGPYHTPFGSFSHIVLSNFGGADEVFHSGNEYFTYSGANGPTFTNYLTGGTVSFTNGTFEVEILHRTDDQDGTFSAKLLEATFSGQIAGQNVVAELKPASSSLGTVTYIGNPLLGTQTVSTDFSVAGGYTVNGGPFQSTPLTGTSSAVPEPSTWAMLLVGFGALGFIGWRRRSLTIAAA
jgi:hypothetical protein